MKSQKSDWKSLVNFKQLSKSHYRLNRLLFSFGYLLFVCFFSACQSTERHIQLPYLSDPQPSSNVLRAGDTLRITFQGAPDLETTQQIRSDGMITLPALGQFKAANLTPGVMETQLIDKFGSQLLTKSASVTLLSAHFPVYVSGAVMNPGKIVSDRPLTALDAIMEAGGFDMRKANMKKVTIIRQNETEPLQYSRYQINFDQIFKGSSPEAFKLQTNDVIYVPERFEWF